jgi:hypothetical protein
MEGKIFGFLTVLKQIERKINPGGTKTRQWLCICTCGKEIICIGTWLRASKNSKISCGCQNYTRPHGNVKHSPEMSSRKALFNRMKQTARKRRISWDLNFEDWLVITKEKCFWCGEEPFEKYNYAISKNGYSQMVHSTERVNNCWITYNGIDRKDNNTGYTKENCQTSCKWCNFARNEMTDEQFRNWIRKVAKHAVGIS